MDSRAKLRYDGLSYYDEDLEKIAKQFCKNLNYKYKSYGIDRILDVMLIKCVAIGMDSVCQLPLKELKNYRISLTNEKPIINWPSAWGHFIYYRKDIWELADLVTKWNGYKFKDYKLDNRGKFLYIYFYHPEGKNCFIAVGYKDIEMLRYHLHDKNAKGVYMKSKACGENLGF